MNIGIGIRGNERTRETKIKPKLVVLWPDDHKGQVGWLLGFNSSKGETCILEARAWNFNLLYM